MLTPKSVAPQRVTQYPFSQTHFAQSIAPIVFVGTLIFSLPGILELPRELAGASLTLIVALPIIIGWALAKRILIADPIIIIGLMWFLAAGLPALIPALYQDYMWRSISPAALEEATQWFYRGWAICSLIYWGTLSLVARRRGKIEAVVARPSVDRLRVLIGIFGLVAAIAYLLRTGGQNFSHIEIFTRVSTIDQIIQEFRNLSMIYIFLYFLARGQKRLFRVENTLLIFTLIAYAFIFASAASKGVALQLIAMWILGVAAGSGTTSVKREAVIGIVAVLLIYWVSLFVTAYRVELVARSITSSSDLYQAIAIQIDSIIAAFGTLISGDPIGSEGNPYGTHSILDRLALVLSFGKMIDLTQGVSPYQGAISSFFTPIYAVLPRALFPMKEVFFHSGAYAQMLGWSTGGFSVSLPGSFFWAWGYAGIAAGMGLIGFVLAVLQRFSQKLSASGLIAQAILALIVLSLLDVGGSFQSLVVSGIRGLLILISIHVLSLVVFSRRTRLRA